MAETQNAPSHNKNVRKHKKIKRFFLFIAIIFIVWWFNNFTVKLNYNEIHSPKITSQVRIAVMSDFHAGKYNPKPEKILSKLKKSDPDIVFFLGDMYSRSSTSSEVERAVKLMSDAVKLGSPVYFVPGDHDTSDIYLDELRAAKIHVMDYKNEAINVNGNNIQIYGIDNVYFSPTFDLRNEFTLSDSYFNILMAHIPTYDKYAEFGADLTICGDTHGGIIQLPFAKGPVYYNDTKQWLPEISGKRDDVYDKGFFDYSGGTMFITSGLGNHPYPARLNNRPEIAIIDILPQ